MDRLGTAPLVEELATIALSELHHDAGDGDPEVKYERRRLEVKFTLAIRRTSKDERLVEFAKWIARKQAEFHGCLTGDCPHMLQDECSRVLVREFKKDDKA